MTTRYRNILSVGSLVIDHIGNEMAYGGASSNISRNAVILGLSSMIYTIPSANTEYKAYVKSLNNLGIVVYETSANTSSLPHNYFEVTNNGQIRHLRWEDNQHIESFARSKPENKTLRKGSIVHLAVCEKEFAYKVSQLLDPSQKLSFNPGPWIYEYSSKEFLAIAKRADYVFLNDSEAKHILDNNWIKSFEELTKDKHRIIILTNGDQPTIMLQKNIRLQVPSFSITPVNELGAGDGFVSGFLWALEKGYSLYDSVRSGNAMGAAITSQYLPYASEFTLQSFHEHFYR